MFQDALAMHAVSDLGFCPGVVPDELGCRNVTVLSELDASCDLEPG